MTFSCTLCALLSGVTRNSRAPRTNIQVEPSFPFPYVAYPSTLSLPSLPFALPSLPTPPHRITKHSRLLHADGNSLTITPGLFALKLRPVHFRPTLEKAHSSIAKVGAHVKKTNTGARCTAGNSVCVVRLLVTSVNPTKRLN